MTRDKKERDDSNAEKGIVFIDTALEDLIPGFLENRNQDIKLILDAFTRNDYTSLSILGQTLKRFGDGFGIKPLTDIGDSIEQAAKDENSEKIKQSLKELKNYLKKIEIFFGSR